MDRPSLIAPGSPVVGGTDIGQKRDRAACAVVSHVGWRDVPREDVEDATERKPVYAADAMIWTPPDDGRAFDIGTVRAHWREVAAAFELTEVSYDPWRFEESAQMLADEGLDMHEFPQTNERMAPASQLAYDLIVSGCVRHNGDPEFARHVLAGAMTDTGERGWRLTKRKATKPIDALIALVMALYRAEQLRAEKSTYEDNEPLVLG